MYIHTSMAWNLYNCYAKSMCTCCFLYISKYVFNKAHNINNK